MSKYFPLRFLPMLWLAAWLALPAFALEMDKPIVDFLHDSWTVDTGLPQSTVRGILQTHDGYIWFATHEGAARYDGQHFKVFDQSNTPSLAGGGISAFCEGSDGSLYIGLRDGGVVRYHAGKFAPLQTDAALPRSEVLVMVEDKAGALWIGTSGDGLLRWQGGKLFAYTTADGLPNNIITALMARAGGDVLVGTQSGMAAIHDGKLQTRPSGTDADTQYVSSLAEDGAGHLVIGTYRDGLFLQEGDRWRHITRREGLTSDSILVLQRDRAGSLWIGCLEGLHRLRNGVLDTYTKVDGLTNNLVRSIAEDSEGGLWVGTNAGLDRFRDGVITSWGQRRGITEEFTRVVIEDKAGITWVGTADGLFRLEGKYVRRFTRADGLVNNAILALAEGNDGTIWIGTDAGGLHRYRNGGMESLGTRYAVGPSAVRAIVQARNRDLWVGTNAGLVRIGGDESVKHYDVAQGLPSSQVLAIMEHADGSLWVGTRAGLVVFRDGEIDPAGTAIGVKDWVQSITTDTAGNVLVGTSNGLVRVVGDKAQFLGIAQGLPGNTIFSVIDDTRGGLWMCSNHGLMQLRKSDIDEWAAGTRQKVEPLRFNHSDGMPSQQCNGGSQPAGWRTRDKRILFATAHGVAVIDGARQRVRNLRPPPVHLTNIAVDAVEVPFNEGVVLPPGNHRIEFSFVALSFPDPAKVRFRYRLNGYDSDWIEGGNDGHAIYTNLKPGDYQFQVIASNNDGIWNETGASVNVDFRPGIAETAWFRLIGSLLVLVLVYLAYRARTLQLKRSALELQQRVDEQTADLAREKEKLEIANEEKARLLIQVREQSEAYKRLSNEDALTGLANRRELDRLLSLEFERARRNPRPLAVVLADLDHFKRINDHFSHSTGDEVLRVVGRVFREGCRVNDVAARYGGEEFALVLPDTNIDESAALCERLRVEIEQYDWSQFHPDLKVTMSFGIALAAGIDHKDKLLDAADHKLYEAKVAGRNRVCY